MGIVNVPYDRDTNYLYIRVRDICLWLLRVPDGYLVSFVVRFDGG